MWIVVVIIILAIGIGIGILVARQRGAGSDSRPTPAAAPKDPFSEEDSVAGDPRAIKAGDMLEYLGHRYFVRGSLRMREGGFSWDEHIIDDTEGSKVWISVEEDPDLEVVWWTERELGDLLPDNKTLTVDGVDYLRTEHGTAEYRREGTTGISADGRVEYVDYEGPRGKALGFERYLSSDGKGRWEVSVGEQIPSGSLTIYPGS